MENCDKERPGPEVERRGKPTKFLVIWADKELGPWDGVNKKRETPSVSRRGGRGERVEVYRKNEKQPAAGACEGKR